MALKFYMTPGSCSTGIHILLETLELPFEAWIINIPAGEHLRPELDFGQFSSAARDAEHRITLNDLVSALEHELHAAEVPECRPPPFDA